MPQTGEGLLFTRSNTARSQERALMIKIFMKILTITRSKNAYQLKLLRTKIKQIKTTKWFNNLLLLVECGEVRLPRIHWGM